MRILFFFPHCFVPARAGCHRRALQIVEALLRAGHAVVVAGIQGNALYPWDPAAEESLRALGVSALHLWHPHSRIAPRGWFDGCLNRERPDVLWMNYASHDPLVNHATLRARGVLTVIDTHDLLALNDAMQRRLAAVESVDRGAYLSDSFARSVEPDRAALLAELSVYRQYQHVLCLSLAEVELLAPLLPHQRVLHAPMTCAPVDLANTYEGSPLFTTAINPFNRQGYAWLAERVLPNCPGVQVEVFGNLCETLATRDGLTLRGFVPDLAPCYERAAYALCPLLSGTGQKVKIIEAMANGLAVVTTRQAGAGSPVIHGRSGFLVDSAEDFAAAVRQLSSDRDLRRRMGDASREEIRRHWGPSRIDGLVREILGPPGRDAVAVARTRARSVVTYPGGHHGRGIVTCAGGEKYFPSGWVLVRRLRALGCTLPIEWWYLGRDEMSPRMIELLAPFGVRCVDAHEVARQQGIRRLCGYALKSFATVHSAFDEVLFVDADNVPVRDPSFLFDEAAYLRTGVLLWPDRHRGRQSGRRYKTLKESAYSLLGLTVLDEPETESGQLLVRKSRAWHALDVALTINLDDEFWYQHFYGDKDVLRLVLHLLGQPFSVVEHACTWPNDKAIYQKAPDGDLLFQHRCGHKWLFRQNNPTPPGFVHQAECQGVLDELVALWDGRVRNPAEGGTPRENDAYNRIVAQRWFHYVRCGQDVHPVELLPHGEIRRSQPILGDRWRVCEGIHGVSLTLSDRAGPVCELHEQPPHGWSGRWQRHQRFPVLLRPAEGSAAGANA